MKTLSKRIREIFLFFQAIFALFQAWNIKSRRNMLNVQFASKNNLKHLSRDDVSFLVSCSDFIVQFGTFGSGRKCFFRAYILGAVLNKWDVPVVMNVGLYDLTGDRRRRGHCWLTLDNELIAESSEKIGKYNVQLATGVNGVRYWLGSNTTNANLETV